MKKLILIAIAATLLSSLVSSAALCANGEVYLGGYLLLRIRCGAGGFTLEQRTDKLQARANDLLAWGRNVQKFTVQKSKGNVGIYADNTLFLTVAPGDAKANNTTVEKLAKNWAGRLTQLYPEARPDKQL